MYPILHPIHIVAFTSFTRPPYLFLCPLQTLASTHLPCQTSQLTLPVQSPGLPHQCIPLMPPYPSLYPFPFPSDLLPQHPFSPPLVSSVPPPRVFSPRSSVPRPSSSSRPPPSPFPYLPYPHLRPPISYPKSAADYVPSAIVYASMSLAACLK